MASIQEHYDTHLAPLYDWMSGGAAGPRARFAALLEHLQLRPNQPGATALDLGAGSGFQSVPLAQTGFAVTAVDLSSELLRTLSQDSAGLPIQVVRGDLRNIREHCPTPAPELIVCMGDTLTHLASSEEVSRLINDCRQSLAKGGTLLLSFRDYTAARTGGDRFIPVRSDRDRIFTCFLEFTPTHVAVHDILHVRDGEGWRPQISAYEKVRLDPAWTRRELAAAGFELIFDETKNGLVTLAARRPHSL